MVAAIVEAATRILVADGFEGMNVNRVAELAGVSVGSLYQYFPSKEAVVGAVANKLGDDTAQLVADRIGELEGTAPADAIRGAISCVLDAYRINPPLRRVIREQVPEVVPHFATPEVDEQVRAAIASYLNSHRDHLRPANLELAMQIVFTTVEAVCDSTTESNRDDVLEELTAMLERYLLHD